MKVSQCGMSYCIWLCLHCQSHCILFYSQTTSCFKISNFPFCEHHWLSAFISTKGKIHDSGLHTHQRHPCASSHCLREQPASISLCLDLLALTFHRNLVEHVGRQTKPVTLACYKCLHTQMWGLLKRSLKHCNHHQAVLWRCCATLLAHTGVKSVF